MISCSLRRQGAAAVQWLPKKAKNLNGWNIDLRERVALCVGSAVGYCGPGIQPVWVAALIKDGLLTTSQVGWLASGELFAMATTILAVSAWGKHGSPRRIAALGAATMAVANTVAMHHAVQAVVIGRLLNGFGIGTLLASVTGVAACRLDAARVLALMQGASVLLMSGVYFVSPILIGKFGTAGLFAILSSGGALVTLAALMGLPALPAVPTVATRVGNTRKLAPILGCLGLAVVFAGQNMVGTYLVTIGNSLGFDSRTMGIILAILPPLAMLAPVAAHALGERVGLLQPLLIGLAALTIDTLCVVHAATPILFGFAAVLLNVSIMFCIPYATALLGRFDASGRFASAAPAFMMVGGAIGPALGSRMVGTIDFQMLAIVASFCTTGGIVLFSLAAGFAKMHVGFRRESTGDKW